VARTLSLPRPDSSRRLRRVACHAPGESEDPRDSGCGHAAFCGQVVPPVDGGASIGSGSWRGPSGLQRRLSSRRSAPPRNSARHWREAPARSSFVAPAIFCRRCFRSQPRRPAGQTNARFVVEQTPFGPPQVSHVTKRSPDTTHIPQKGRFRGASALFGHGGRPTDPRQRRAASSLKRTACHGIFPVVGRLGCSHHESESAPAARLRWRTSGPRRVYRS